MARRHFAEKGYAKATFKEIGAELGMSHTALYAYFSTKSDLYVATLESTQALLLPRYLDAIASGSTLRERMAKIVMVSAEANDEGGDLTGFLAAVPIELSRDDELFERVAQTQDTIFSALDQIFEEAKQKGEIKATIPTHYLISTLLGGGVGVALFQYGLREPQLTGAMEVFVSLIEGTLFNES